MRELDFRYWTRRAADWIVDYRGKLRHKPVRPKVEPGSIMNAIPDAPPRRGENMETVFRDFERLIPDAMTHWQHPRFFAYFQSNAAPAAVVAEQLVAGMAAQCMLWQTAPAATELEIKMVDWLRQALGLPIAFKGTMQDTASSATLCAVLMMRERALGHEGNVDGLFGKRPVRIYASAGTHSSVDKALWVAGLGQDNLVKIPTRADHSMDLDLLKAAIGRDRAQGLLPGGIIICVGGTSIGACDHVREICELADHEGLFTHIDAAWAGSAMICPEFRRYWDGAERADSIVLNPHKWLGVPMECSLHLVKDPDLLIRTLSIQPEYLKTHGHDDIVNFSEWSVQLGRRFRALKVWFLLRVHGLEDLQKRIRQHVTWSCLAAEKLRAEPDFEIATEPFLSLFSFRYLPAGYSGDADALNLALVAAINDDGRTYLTQTTHDGQIVIRFVTGHFETTADDVEIATAAIIEVARSLQFSG